MDKKLKLKVLSKALLIMDCLIESFRFVEKMKSMLLKFRRLSLVEWVLVLSTLTTLIITVFFINYLIVRFDYDTSVKDLTATGQIGDFFGGVIGSLLTFISILLIIWSTNKQTSISILPMLSERVRSAIENIHLDVSTAYEPEYLLRENHFINHYPDSFKSLTSVVSATFRLQQAILNSNKMETLFKLVDSISKTEKIPHTYKNYLLNLILTEKKLLLGISDMKYILDHEKIFCSTNSNNVDFEKRKKFGIHVNHLVHEAIKKDEFDRKVDNALGISHIITMQILDNFPVVIERIKSRKNVLDIQTF